MSYIDHQKSIHGGDDRGNLSSESDVEEETEGEEEENETISSPLNSMSTMLRQLPVKRGLSKHYDGKSQSFASLSNVKCLEDLPKVENSYNDNTNNKKLKSCRSYGGLMFYSDQKQPTAAAAASMGSCSGHEGYLGSGSSSRPPIAARSRTASTIYSTGGALLFA